MPEQKEYLERLLLQAAKSMVIVMASMAYRPKLVRWPRREERVKVSHRFQMGITPAGDLVLSKEWEELGEPTRRSLDREYTLLLTVFGRPRSQDVSFLSGG